MPRKTSHDEARSLLRDVDTLRIVGNGRNLSEPQQRQFKEALKILVEYVKENAQTDELRPYMLPKDRLAQLLDKQADVIGAIPMKDLT